MDPGTIYLIAAIAPTLLNLLFGGNKSQAGTQTVVQKTETPPRGIQDPTLGLLMPYMSDMLLRMMGSYGGAGMPAGKSFNSPFGGDIMGILMQNWPDLMAAYKNRSTSNRLGYSPNVVRRDTLGRA